MVKPEVLKALLADLRGQIRELKEDQAVSYAGFSRERRVHKTVERTLETAIQCCLDIGPD